MVAEHHGDTRGNDYYTDIICLSADAAKPVRLIPKDAPRPSWGVKPFG
jgi:hypothetical protein